jgi:hypothetical protein
MSTEALITALGLRTRFPKEHDTWERNKKDIERRFQKVLSQQRTEVCAKIEEGFKQVRAGVEGFVVSEMLKLFPWALKIFYERLFLIPDDSMTDHLDAKYF